MMKLWEKSRNRQGISGDGFDDTKGYFAPETLKEVTDLLSQYGEDVKILAGGTDLLVQYYERLYEVKNWLDLKKIKELKEIKIKEDRIEIGAMVTHAQLERSEEIEKYLPVLSKAAADVGSPQIRNRGTIGGNISNASPAGDLLPPLIAYGAEIKLVSAEEERTISLREFFTGPKKTIKKPGEVLTRIIVKIPAENTFGSWIKVGKRKALVISTISLAVVIKLDQDRQVEMVSVCLGSVAPTPIQIEEIKDKMIGKNLRELDFNVMGRLIEDKISPIDDIRGTREYRKDVAREIMINALEEISQEVGIN